MYNKIIQLLKNKNIILEKGLSDEEISMISSIYNFKFPECYEAFFKEVLPISDGFYNWRDFSYDNINRIKGVMEFPFYCIRKMISELEWNDKWGREVNGKKRMDIINNQIRNAPKLIPIFLHRYFPLIDCNNPPVISIHGVDIIYYGENIQHYFNNEFGDYCMLMNKEITYIPFWSDIM